MCVDVVLATPLIDSFESLIISSQKIIYGIKIIYGTEMNSMEYSCQMQSVNTNGTINGIQRTDAIVIIRN